jgi:hypothetical protein
MHTAASIALIGSRPKRQWQGRLAAALRRDGHAVAETYVAASDGPGHGAGLALLLAMEQFAYGARSSAFMAVKSDAPAAADGESVEPYDVTIELRPEPALATAGACLIPLFDDAPGETALLTALLDGRAPELSVAACYAGREPRIVARGMPAWEDRNILSVGLDQVLARMADLLRQCVNQIARGSELQGEVWPPSSARLPAAALSFAVRSVTSKIAARLTRLATRPDHWSIAFRALNDDAVIERGAWPDLAWTGLADDGGRFYADPFPLAANGRTYIFCEEFPYATRKGIISVFEIGADGAPSKPRPVLERPYHLSYPFVFRRGLHIFMIPETGAAGRIELYRADPFPDRWAFERVLVDNVVASDATLATWQGREWLFASIAGAGASTWDALGLFHAPDLFGAWEGHPLNPVLIDAGAARPAGAMVASPGRLRRVAQDCRARYGGGIAIVDVESLDAESYRQNVKAALAPPPGLDAIGVHTLNAAGSLEIIDLVGPMAKA